MARKVILMIHWWTYGNFVKVPCDLSLYQIGTCGLSCNALIHYSLNHLKKCAKMLNFINSC